VVAGVLLSAAALTLDCVIAGLGLELVKFHALQRRPNGLATT
jgi:hypothetical protein